MDIDVIVNLYYPFVIVKPVKASHVLLESAAPGNGHGQKEGVQSGIIKPFSNIPSVDRITRSFESGKALI